MAKLTIKQKEALELINVDGIASQYKIHTRTLNTLQNKGLITIKDGLGKLTNEGLKLVSNPNPNPPTNSANDFPIHLNYELDYNKPIGEVPKFIVQHSVCPNWYWKRDGEFAKIEDAYVFTEKECRFLDRYKANVATLHGSKYYCGFEILNKATLTSIPNSNFSVYGKNLKALRSTHEVGQSFWTEKWRDTTRKRRDKNNEIMFGKALNEMYMKYKGAFSLFAIENHINKHCFLGGRYYNGQTIANSNIACNMIEIKDYK